MERDLTLTWVGRARSSRAGPPASYRGLFKAAFSSSAADSSISRESVSSLTARAIETAPTSAERAAMALTRRDFRVPPTTSLVSSSR